MQFLILLAALFLVLAMYVVAHATGSGFEFFLRLLIGYLLTVAGLWIAKR